MNVWWQNLRTRWHNFRQIHSMNRVIVKRRGEKRWVIYTTGDDREDDLRIALSWLEEAEES